jgi:ACS family glucarate transporter-like MFS transporter
MPNSPAPVAPPSRPTRVRWKILVLVMLVTALTYVDRVNLSVAGKYIQDEFRFGAETMGWIFSAFLAGYALLQVPAGWAGDRYGARKVLTGAILGWSVFTAATALAPNLPWVSWLGVAGSFLLVRFLVGVGEAACSPNLNKIVGSWMGENGRGVGASFMILGVGLGGAATPPLIAWIMQRWGWRSSFFFCALVGVVFACVWHRMVTNRPEEHSRVNPAELRLIRSQTPATLPLTAALRRPWRRMLGSRSVWGLLLGYFCQGYPIYFYHTWFFLYLVRVRGLSVMQSGLWDMTPYLAIAALAPFGGWFSDFAVTRLGRRNGRRAAVWLGMLGSAALLWLGSRSPNRTAAILLLAGASGLNMFAASTFWATCIDLTSESTGSLSGLMNMFGNAGGWLSPILTAWIAVHFGWDRALDVAALVTGGSALSFAMVDASLGLDSLPSPTAPPATGATN